MVLIKRCFIKEGNHLEWCFAASPGKKAASLSLGEHAEETRYGTSETTLEETTGQLIGLRWSRKNKLKSDYVM